MNNCYLFTATNCLLNQQISFSSVKETTVTCKLQGITELPHINYAKIVLKGPTSEALGMEEKKESSDLVTFQFATLRHYQTTIYTQVSSSGTTGRLDLAC